METEKFGECRLCGGVDLKIHTKINDKIDGSYCCKDYVEYICQVKLSSDENLPQDVCTNCYSTIMKFGSFTKKLEIHQNTLKNRTQKNDDNKESPTTPKEATKRKRNETSASSSKNSSGSKSNSSSENNESSSSSEHRMKVRKCGDNNDDDKFIKTCLTKSIDLFKDEIENQPEDFDRITIKPSLLLEGGRISKNWLSKYNNFVTWQEIPHSCRDHCKKKFKSLSALLKHYDEINLPHSKRTTACSSCKKVFKVTHDLSTYINHICEHHNHLKYGCIFCDGIFVNINKLCEHHINKHGNQNYEFYPCLICGISFSSISELEDHKKFHSY